MYIGSKTLGASLVGVISKDNPGALHERSHVCCFFPQVQMPCQERAREVAVIGRSQVETTTRLAACNDQKGTPALLLQRLHE
jgi:hypothetical protein